jgi:hypothetical protein
MYVVGALADVVDGALGDLPQPLARMPANMTHTAIARGQCTASARICRLAIQPHDGTRDTETEGEMADGGG